MLHLRSLLAILVVAGSVVAGASSHASAVVMPTQFEPVKVAPGPRPGSYALKWSAAEPATGYVFDVQMKHSGSTAWTSLRAGTTALGQTFTPSVPGPYSLRARLRNTTNGHSSTWSTAITLVGNWSMFQIDQQHTGVTRDPALGASTAARLKVRWKRLVAAGEQLFSSPAVAFNAQLHKPLVYAAGSSGTVTARDLATGTVVWTAAGNGPIVSSPAVLGNSVYIGTESHYLFALDATTGAVQCAFSLGGAVISSPVVGSVDGTGPVVFFGDVEAGNGGHEWAVNAVGNSGGACSRKWDFNAWNNAGVSAGRTGSWSPPALTKDSTGRPLLVFGTSDPDDSVYALDARSGTLVWRFQTESTHPDEDVGAAPTISRPGVNGFAHGVVYVAGKNDVEYALDLLTGTKIWEFDLQKSSGGASATAQSAAALVANRIVVAYGRHVFSLNATTGARMWRSGPAAGNYFGSPSVSGAPGDEVVVIGDDAGVEHAYRFRDGSQVWQLDTGSPVYASAALAFGAVLFGGTNGFLYALG